MESLSKDKAIEILSSTDSSLFTYSDLAKLFGKGNDNTLRKYISRLKKYKILTSLVRGKYLYNYGSAKYDDYTLANFIVEPSYISLETALNYYSLLDQASYPITSVIVGKTRKLTLFNGKEYTYSGISSKYFTDYKKVDTYLIANPQKAVLDYLYLAYKGLKSRNNIDLINFQDLNISRDDLRKYLVEVLGNNLGFLTFFDSLKIYDNKEIY